MTKQKYYDLIQNQKKDVTEKIMGYHETVNILQIVEEYVITCIHTCEDIYNDSGIGYAEYVELNDGISKSLKEICRIVRMG